MKTHRASIAKEIKKEFPALYGKEVLDSKKAKDYWLDGILSDQPKFLSVLCDPLGKKQFWNLVGMVSLCLPIAFPS